ncbi:MAG: hypothetical protein WD669_00055 [Pirellulales bacterium]
MTRRRFAFWLGFGLFSLADKLHINALDAWAAAAMGGADSKTSETAPVAPQHWTVGGDENWRWYERETRINGQWVQTGTTAPIHKTTGERKAEKGVYLDDRLVPAEMRSTAKEVGAQQAGDSKAAGEAASKVRRRLPTATRRSRHGRPPSKWLRSLNADELRIWLKTIEAPEAGVSGMTYWEHLTRDHMFDPIKIKGLAEPEQAKLHAAAHFGY